MYRFTAEHFPLFDPRSKILAADAANWQLEQWEKKSQKIYGRWDSLLKRFPSWLCWNKKTEKLNREDYSHKAFVWNPQSIEEKSTGELPTKSGN